MPYDEEGNFIYPLPPKRKTNKSQPKKSKAVPTIKKKEAVEENPPLITPDISPFLSSTFSPNLIEPKETINIEDFPAKPEDKEKVNNGKSRAASSPTINRREKISRAASNSTRDGDKQASRAEPFPTDTDLSKVVQPLLNLQSTISNLQFPASQLPIANRQLLSSLVEQDLAELWNAQNWTGAVLLQTTEGLPVQVIYRGRWSGGIGPDFRGAIINIGGQLYRGDVELHLRTSQWREHHHQFDPHYNNIILHVALYHDAPTTTADGHRPPILALYEVFGLSSSAIIDTLEKVKSEGTRLGSVSENSGKCCEHIAERNPDIHKVLEEIDRLGERRFLEKAERYEAAIAQNNEILAAQGGTEIDGAVQAFWSGFLEALGYSQNKEPFKLLAETLPFTVLLELDLNARRQQESPTDRLLTIEAALLGSAGLLPSQRKPRRKSKDLITPTLPLDVIVTDETPPNWAAQSYFDELERRWLWLERELKISLPGFAFITKEKWSFGRVRPLNHPARRIAGLARWLVRLSPASADDLIASLTDGKDNLFLVGVENKKENHADSDSFWAQHFDLNFDILPLPDKIQAAPDLIGADRAADIVVNVALPFLYGYACDSGQRSLAEKTLSAYRKHSKLGSNELIETMVQQVLGYWWNTPGAMPSEFCGKNNKPSLSRLISTTMRQQGLIHLHHNFCAEQNFAACPFNSVLVISEL